eukprot:scaffold121745_cov35-Attheya_sp.AAC.1
MKEDHKPHSETLFVIRKEIQVDNESLDDGTNTNDHVNNEEVAKVQAQVVEYECEAAVDEANQVLVLAVGIIFGLKEEIQAIAVHILLPPIHSQLK